MDWRYLYTNFDGRLSRKPYWLANIVLIVAGIVLQTIVLRTLGFAAALIFSLIWLYPTFALNVKRAHDRNRPTWLMLVFFALLVIMIAMQIIGLDQAGDDPTTAFLIVGISWFALAAFFIVDLGFLRGTVGPNRYGPDPLAQIFPGGGSMNSQLFFSFRGRINRASYWLVTLVNFAIFFGFMALAYLLGSWFFFVPALFLIPMLISAIAIMVKRLHDREKSAWWLLFFYVLPAVLSGMQKMLRSIPEMTASFLGFACAVVGAIISIWALIELGFLRGTIGPNRYGPDPLR